VSTKQRTKTPEPNIREEAMAHAEQQLATDRALILQRIGQLGTHISEKSMSGVARTLVEINWLEHRLSQYITMNTPLWCAQCAEPAEYPGNPYMVFECLAHAEPQLERSAKDWQWLIFGGVA